MNVLRITFLIFAILTLLTSCKARECAICDNGSDQGGVWEPPPPLNQSQFCGDDFTEDSDELIQALGYGDTADPHADPAQVVLLSGGGSRGSFGAGFMEAWRKEGNLPKFDMVTGISTGAILASWIYLGDANSYEIMRTSYNGEKLTNANIRSRRWLFPLVNSEFNLKPLLRLMENEVMTDELIASVGEEYENTGRQLWIGSTNLETGQFCHWNLGLRARKAKNASGEERAVLMNHYRMLIIASSANPTVFQSVKISQNPVDPDSPAYFHADGGVSQMIYVESLETIAEQVIEMRGHQEPEFDKIPEMNVWAIVNGRLMPSQQCAAPGILSLGQRSLTLIEKSALRNDLANIKVEVDSYMGTQPWNYMTAWIDYRKKLGGAAEFGQEVMKPIYDYGAEYFDRQHWCTNEIPHPDAKNKLCRIPVAGRPHCPSS
jgi:predicted acylesterase/phospholipase RssA